MGRCLHTLSGHTNVVHSIEALPNNRLASYSIDGSIKLWSLETVEILKEIEDAVDENDHSLGNIKAWPYALNQLLSCCGKS